MSAIKNWYAGKNVLVSGVTGFVGKVLVERLLREFDDVNCIYLLVRGKKDSFDARCNELLSQIAFEHIRKSKPTQFEKIKFIEGDLTHDNLGLSYENLTEIVNNIDIVIHSGADVRFDLPLRDIFNTNTMGTYRFMELAKQIKNLEVFVFVSTAYSQSHQNVTEERYYGAEMDVFVLMKAFDRFDDQTMIPLQSKILKEFPNTYSFSKHLSECIVHQYRDQIPICVVRPSIVCSSIAFPMPYYSEGLNGINGWSFASARGVLRTSICDTASKAYLIPVDVVANTIIATSWIHGTKKVDHIEYYTANFKNENCETFAKLNVKVKLLYAKYPLDFYLWCPNSTITSCKYYYYTRTFFYQILPAIILDLLIRIFRRKPIILEIQRKIYYTFTVLMPYLRQMIFKTDNFNNIQNYLSPVDRITFDTNIDDVTMEKIIITMLRGNRKFLAKEKDEDLPRARKVYLIWSWIHWGMTCIVALFLARYVFDRIFQNILN